jgi:hypothetical protein
MNVSCRRGTNSMTKCDRLVKYLGWTQLAS